MKRLLAKAMTSFEAITTQLIDDVRPRSAAEGYELSPVEVDAVHGGGPLVCYPFGCGEPNAGPILPHMHKFTRKFKQLADSLS
jgi:hypothetical protein